MENDFFEFVEHWCRIYKPIAHDGERHRQFFLTESFYGLMDFMREIDAESEGPCVIMENMTEGHIDKHEHTDYTIYFFVRAEEQGDGELARVALNQAKEHARNFIRYIRTMKFNEGFPFRNINLSDVRFQPVGPLYNHWYGIGITLEDIQQFNHCQDESLYFEP